MAVSAYWYIQKQKQKKIIGLIFIFLRHGLHPGYYLAMISTTPCMFAENLIEKEFKNRFINKKYYKIYDNCMCFLFRMRQFEFMSIGMIYLTYDATIKYWSSLYFIGHVQCAFLILFALLLKLIPKKYNKIE